MADKNLIDEAIKKSEELQIEQAMLDDKLKATDWEATNEELMEMVARESYLQWIKDNEKRNKTLNTSYDDYLDNLMNHNAPCSSWDSLRNDFSSSNSNTNNNKSNHATSSNNNSDKNKKLYDDDWSNYETGVEDEEDDILAKVLQDSQQEYLENLKSNRSQKKD